MTKQKPKTAETYDPANGTAAAQAREKRRQRAAGLFLANITRQRLRYVALLRDFASAAAAAPGYDGAPPEIIDTPEPGENPQLRVSRNVREHPLDLMAHKRQISVEQFGAGDLFRRDLEMSLISPLSGRSFESIYTVELSNAKAKKEAGLADMLGPKTFAARGAKQPLIWKDLQPMTLDAMDRAKRAHVFVERVAGRDAAVIATLLCRDRLNIGEIASTKRYGNRNRVGRKMQEALDALADHYGTRPGRGKSGIRSWGDGNHVPSLDGASDAHASPSARASAPDVELAEAAE